MSIWIRIQTPNFYSDPDPWGVKIKYDNLYHQIFYNIFQNDIKTRDRGPFLVSRSRVLGILGTRARRNANFVLERGTQKNRNANFAFLWRNIEHTEIRAVNVTVGVV